MTQPPNQPPQPPNQPPGYGYPNSGEQNPYGAAPGAGPYQQPQYGYPQAGGYPAGGAVPPPGAFGGDPNAPYGYDPYGRPYSDKSKIVAGILQLFLGSLGIGRFYIGSVGIALGQLFTCGGLGIWALVDGIILLTSDNVTDSQGRVLRG